jgi:hypothetical protein
MLDLTAARAAVSDLCEPTLNPILDTSVGGEIDKALGRTQLAATWVASTAYHVGQRIVPSIPEGRLYVCVLSGTSDTTEPPWLVAPQYTGAVNPLGAWWGIGAIPFIENVTTTPWFWGLADGTAAWRFDSAFAGEIYDVRSAAAECWRMRARKVANQPKRKRLGPLLQDYLTYEQCMDQARSLQPVRVA